MSDRDMEIEEAVERLDRMTDRLTKALVLVREIKAARRGAPPKKMAAGLRVSLALAKQELQMTVEAYLLVHDRLASLLEAVPEEGPIHLLN